MPFYGVYVAASLCWQLASYAEIGHVVHSKADHRDGGKLRANGGQFLIRLSVVESTSVRGR